jgi:hypothetical protein
VSESLLESPFKIQSAIDRQWEKAWKVSLDDFVYTEDQIRDFVKGESQIVGVELFYKAKAGTDLYLGMQYHQDLTGIRSPFEFVAAYFRAISELKDRSFQNVIYRLGEVLNQAPSTFVFDEPSSILMGVVDWWLTFGPCEIWRRSEEKRISLHALKQKLEGHLGLISNERNYTGLEFVYDLIPKYWISFQVGELKEGRFQLNYDRTLQLLSEYLSFAR